MRVVIIPKQERVTRRVELVETHNIALSLQRIDNAPSYNSRRWRRALLHALMIHGVGDGTVEKIRVALELP